MRGRLREGRYQIFLLLGALVFFSFLLLKSETIQAQVQRDWSPLFQLSTGRGTAIEAALVNDRFGKAHALWAESPGDGTTLIQYANFNGSIWSFPNDLLVVPGNETIETMALDLDKNDWLHLVWTQGQNSNLVYSRAPIYKARSAQAWQSPISLNIRGDQIAVQVDSQGVIHLVYADQLSQPGIFYVFSEDQGVTWSGKTWLDPEILVGHVPVSLQFAKDDNDNLHVVWVYKSADSSAGDWVRYARSADGGTTWSVPFTIAKNDDGDDKLNAFTRPIMEVNGHSIHIIWAGGELLYRHHRYSEDAGISWSETARVFGNLNGQAGDGMTVDGAGRVHYFGQIRFPQGVYHAMWANGQWSEAEMVYLLRNNAGELFGNNVEAHRTFPVVNAGNQLILTFTDGPTDEERQLYTINKVLDDIPTIQNEPTPTATVPPTLSPPLPTIVPTRRLPLANASTAPAANNIPVRTIIFYGLIPPILLALGMIFFRGFVKK